MSFQPPKWADRFLQWYCNPELLEEIQGDAHELYADRIKRRGKRYADLHYVWDVLTFFRWSNIKRFSHHPAAHWQSIMNFNFKIALRNAAKNKLIFSVKTLGLSVCVAFALLLLAYVTNEITYDKFHANHDRIYRITSKISFDDHLTHFAITPLPIGQTLMESIPEIESYFRLMYDDNPVLTIDGKHYYDEIVLAADSNMLTILTFTFLHGSSNALNDPNKIVLTESLAVKFFGNTHALGRTINVENIGLLEVAAVIKDVPPNSHLNFDALISWDTFNRYDDWSNLNAYTYILLKPDASPAEVKAKIKSVLATFHDLVTREYKATFEPILEKITDIHFSEYLEEDIAEKKNKSNLLILIVMVILFLTTGLINYLNLTLAELTTNLKRIGILRIFGGMAGSHRKIILYDTVLTLIIVIPISLLLFYGGWVASNSYLSIHIDPRALINPVFLSVTFGFIFLLSVSSQVNTFVLTKATDLFNLIKGKINNKNSGTRLRQMLVAAQLAFSIIMIALIFIIVDQFSYIQEADKGFDDKNTIVIKVRSNDQSRIETFIEILRKQSGISKVDGSSYFPGIRETKYVFQVETKKGTEELLVPMIFCGHDYLDALNIKIVKGRNFQHDLQDDNYAYLVNETAVREFGWEDPIGKVISGPLGENPSDDREGEVIGVIRDFNFTTLHTKIEPLIVFLTNPYWGSDYIYVKTDPIHPQGLVSIIEKKFKAQWPEHPYEWEYLDSKYLSLYKKDFEVKNIFEIGLVISILISCLGIFSISALLVTMRTKEMGIRKVVGASFLHLLVLHMKSFLLFLTISILVAWPAIWYLSDKWLENFAYHVNVTAWYFIVPGGIALVITLMTSGYHGVKGALANPVDILKHE
jgi:putative ABC transport system permease protein